MPLGALGDSFESFGVVLGRLGTLGVSFGLSSGSVGVVWVSFGVPCLGSLGVPLGRPWGRFRCRLGSRAVVL